MNKLPKRFPTPCPCHSGKPYTTCCKPFHKGVLPKTATELMRSRYSAYALGLVHYIIETTFDKTHLKEEAILHFCRITQFLDLKILDTTEESTSATVSFRATLTQNGQDTSFKEKSVFEMVNGQWLYKEGLID